MLLVIEHDEVGTQYHSGFVGPSVNDVNGLIVFDLDDDGPGEVTGLLRFEQLEDLVLDFLLDQLLIGLQHVGLPSLSGDLTCILVENVDALVVVHDDRVSLLLDDGFNRRHVRAGTLNHPHLTLLGLTEDGVDETFGSFHQKGLLVGQDIYWLNSLSHLSGFEEEGTWTMSYLLLAHLVDALFVLWIKDDTVLIEPQNSDVHSSKKFFTNIQ